MTDRVVFALLTVSALGCGLSAGVFFAFSTFIMKALRRLPSPQGIAAMQAINVAAPNPAFMLVLFGSAVTSLAAAAWTIVDAPHAGSTYVVAGAALHLVGTVLVTMSFNVPKNEALAAVDPVSLAGTLLWANYVVTWTRWNHVRTASSTAAAAALILGLLAR